MFNVAANMFGPSPSGFIKPFENPLLPKLKPANEMTPQEIENEYTRQPTFEEIRRRRAMAGKNAGMAGNMSPVSSGYEGISRVLAGVNSGLDEMTARRDEQRAQELHAQRMQNMGNGVPLPQPEYDNGTQSPMSSFFGALGFGGGDWGGSGTGGLY